MKFIECQTDKGGELKPVFINVEAIAFFEPHPEKDSTSIALIGGNYLTVRNSFTVVRKLLDVDNLIKR